ncbi:MAG: FtsX-like permease family protein, partial [Chitinivibrionales bacterium]|nr:FtsX-like permease family protein [Chitinivibrionales bacterium]
MASDVNTVTKPGRNTPQNRPTPNGGVLASLAVGAGVLLLVLLSAAFYLRVFKPTRYIVIPEPFSAYDTAPMQQAVDHEVVEAQVDTIMGYGSRLLGQPGMYRTGERIRAAYEAAGLEVYEHDVRTVAPHKAYSEIYPADSAAEGSAYGQPLDSVAIYPFMPNYVQPPVTPDTGLVGELVLLDGKTLRTRENFENVIGVLDNKEGMVDPSYAYAWTRYARLGVKALIVSHSTGGLDSVQWQLVAGRFTGMVVDAPVNFVRVAATREIFDHLGKRVRLRVRVDFKHTPNTVYYGVMRAPTPAREAVVLFSRYDIASILPDRAINPMQTIIPALHLQLVKGMQAYHGTIQRDVIFVASGSGMMGRDGLNHLIRLLSDNEKTTDANPLLAALGIQAKSHEKGRRARIVLKDSTGNQDSLQVLERLAALWGDPSFLRDPHATARALDKLDAHAREFFKDQFSYALNAIVFELNEPKLQAKIAFERMGTLSMESPEFMHYLEAKRAYDEATSAAGYSPKSLLQNKGEYARNRQVRERAKARIDELLAFHRQRGKRLEQELALVRLFSAYDNIAGFHTRLLPALNAVEREQVITLDPGTRLQNPAVPTVANLLMAAEQRLGVEDGLEVVPPGAEQKRLIGVSTDLWRLESDPLRLWQHYGYPAYRFLSVERTESVRQYGFPVDRHAMRDLSTIREALRVTGESIVSLAHGNGDLLPVKNEEHRNKTYGGQVLVSNVGQSIVPNFPLKNAIVSGDPFPEKAMYSRPGFYDLPFTMTDVYGRYSRRNCANEFASWWRTGEKGWCPVAAGYGHDGLISLVKDQGDDGQRLFKSMSVDIGNAQDVTIVVFRAEPVAVVDMTNPQTMKDYSSLDFLDRAGLTRFRKRSPFWDRGIHMAYLEPDERFFVALQSGAPDNELVKMIRAFMLNVDDPKSFSSEKEIDGPGYLVADYPFLLDVPQEAARSMAWVNAQRLNLQNRYSMADEQTNEYHDKTMERLEQVNEAEEAPKHEIVQLARSAVTYATLNHPVLRNSIMEAVMGILWYLALLVPFVFFFEKLVFCNTDVRRQIAAQLIIFLSVFVLLRILHPAFHMVRSSLMILLGFIIILISGGITVLFSSKFQENLEELRKKAGKVAAAEVNKMGVVMSAFMLGLNNMHRRKMRTGLTCATLTLLTFVMICFTSVQNNVVEEDVAVGKAPYQGMLVKRENMKPISENEVSALRAKYGDEHGVCYRRVLLGKQDAVTQKYRNPELEAVYETGDGLVRRYELESAIQMNHNSPLRHQLGFVGTRRWFTEREDQEGSETPVALIPDAMADNLGITPEDAARGDIVFAAGGIQLRVVGIFEAQSLSNLKDLDGRDILPFDVENMVDPVVVDYNIIAGEDDPRIAADRVIITPMRSLFKDVANSSERIVAMNVVMNDAPYREAREDIEAYLEQTGQRVYYGLDGVSYRGRRARATTMAGLIDLIIPLLIAGLTVLNTMKGSVYERRDEIFVYNAVGIAPRYVFFMFIAEAFVYAVVGSVLGYLVSQGTGRILTMLELTGGLNMTYASLATIYASLTIAGAVFFSTYYPAKSAMEIAAPAEESGWALPEPDGDDLEFDLPFNFSTHGRIAVLTFFERYLLDNGEGSAGRFFASVPHMGVAPDQEEGADGGYVPQIVTTIWLKPFDLAVCQRMSILMPPDPETGQYKARI